MRSDVPLDFAVFQLSPKRSRCELLVCSNGRSEKLASGLVKPFVTHLKVAEEQLAHNVQSIKLETGKFNNGEKCLTKGTLERFVRFVSTPEILELVNTLDAEMSQLDAARKIYSLGTGDQHSSDSGGNGAGVAEAADATKKELLRAIDVRLAAVRQDLTTAGARASAAGFNPDSISELRLFADCFGAFRLNEACTKFLSLYQRRPELIPSWKSSVDDCGIRSSCESDMSLDDLTEDSRDTQVKPNSALSHHNHQLIGHSEKVSANQPDAISTQQFKFNSHAIDPKSNKKEFGERSRKDETSPDSLMIQTSQPTRRLSVQDRINLFESKKKETVSDGGGGDGASGGSSSGSGSTSSSKTVATKPSELRRLSSDVSLAPAAVEKAVLRRWSGTSDMSLDLSFEKKDDKESPLCTPSTFSISNAKSTMFSGPYDGKTPKELNVKVDSDKAKVSSLMDGVPYGELKDEGAKQPVLTYSSVKEERSSSESVNKMDASGSHILKMPFAGRIGQTGSSQDGAQSNLKASFGYASAERSNGQTGSEVRPRTLVRKEPKDQATTEILTEDCSRASEVTSNNENGTKAENAGAKNEPVVQSRLKGFRGHSRTLSGQLDGGIRLKAADTPERGEDSKQLTPPLELESQKAVCEGVDKTGLLGLKNAQASREESALQKMKSQRSVSSAHEQAERSQSKRDEIVSTSGNGKVSIFGKKASESRESSLTPPTVTVEPHQRVRQSKGNQELNDDLKLKANELEKLFAEHKLRVPGDLSSSRRGKPTDYQKEPSASSESRNSATAGLSVPTPFSEKRVASDIPKTVCSISDFSTPPSIKMMENNLEASDSRGKFYVKYMEKRNAKLKEEWGSKRAEKEAKLKNMHDSLEQSRAEMEARFAGSTERQDSASSASHRVEKLRSFNSRSRMKRDQPIDFFQSEEDEEDCSGFLEETSLCEAASGEGALGSTQTKKPIPNRNLFSSTPRTSAASASRASVKASNFTSTKRRASLENPLAQSVPNFSDLRKENTRPSSAVSKGVNRSQVRSYARSKSTNNDVPPVKEERVQRSQPLRRSSAGPGELNEVSAPTDDISVLAPLQLDIEQSDQNPAYSDLKYSLRKGDGIGPSTGSARLKASRASKQLINHGDFNDSGFEADDSVSMTEAGENEYQSKDSEHSRLSHESGNSAKSGSDNGGSLRPDSHVNPALVSRLPDSVPSKFFSESLVQDSPGESPISWNSRMHHAFSFPHETSDIDASVDSPMGSPASWNSHSLVQTEADAARMRKKWGSTQKPILVTNSASNQSRRDVSKGFKRLLKFGRKNRGADTLVDWLSVTTSEGDDDTEDVRDPANQSSEDLRKSRMGFMQAHSSEVFMDSELTIDPANSSIPAPPENFKLRDDHISGSSLKAPKSFFSLSNFRSKGSDAKLR